MGIFLTGGLKPQMANYVCIYIVDNSYLPSENVISSINIPTESQNAHMLYKFAHPNQYVVSAHVSLIGYLCRLFL